jgi:hypothetical protein
MRMPEHDDVCLGRERQALKGRERAVLGQVLVPFFGLPCTRSTRLPSASTRICGTSVRRNASFSPVVWVLVHSSDCCPSC